MDNQKKMLEEVMSDLYRVLPILDRVAKKLEDEMYASNDLDQDTRFKIKELQALGYLHIDKVVSQLRYLQKEIRHEGQLYKNENGRYEVDGHELSCGSIVEVWAARYEDPAEWHIIRIESSDQYGGYYAYQWPKLNLEGIKARTRR